MEFNEGELAVEIFGQGGAIFNPIAAVHVNYIAEFANFRTMDVPTNHTGHAALAGELDHRVFIIGNVFDCGFGFQFDVRGERPITKAQAAPEAIDPDIHVQDAVVKDGADTVQKAVEMGKAVELMAVNDEVAFAIGCGVDRPFDQPHRAEAHTGKLFQKFVMIPVDKGDAGFLAVFAQQLLDEKVVFFSPIPFAAQLPAIDEITDDVEVLAIGVAEEIEEFSDLGVFSAQVDIRNPDRAVARILHGTAIYFGHHARIIHRLFTGYQQQSCFDTNS